VREKEGSRETENHQLTSFWEIIGPRRGGGGGFERREGNQWGFLGGYLKTDMGGSKS